MKHGIMIRKLILVTGMIDINKSTIESQKGNQEV